ILRSGSVDTQGDAVINAIAFRNSTGFTGAGATVGVISDTINQVDSNNDGIKGIAESQQTGDLPSAGVNVLQDGPANGATDEGRPMAEIIYDVAPGAALAFSTGGGGPQAMAGSIAALQSTAKANVIVDDIGYPDSPFFNDGVLAQAAEQVVANGGVYVTAAGNDGSNGFQASWRGVPNTTIAGVTGTFADLGTGSTPNFLQTFTLQ